MLCISMVPRDRPVPHGGSGLHSGGRHTAVGCHVAGERNTAGGCCVTGGRHVASGYYTTGGRRAASFSRYVNGFCDIRTKCDFDVSLVSITDISTVTSITQVKPPSSIAYSLPTQPQSTIASHTRLSAHHDIPRLPFINHRISNIATHEPSHLIHSLH